MLQPGRRVWSFPGFERELGDFPLMMGIVNVTPDSFSDGGQFLVTDLAVEHALKLVSDGADILDIGGESTRPGADPVPPDEELHRVIPVIERLARSTTIPISIDTYKAEVAEQALTAGARIVNDITGVQPGSKMLDVCLKWPCGVISMHMQGTPKTMQQNPQYLHVVDELCQHFSKWLEAVEQAGLSRERLVIDPGIGFGKTAQHNLEILSNIGRLHELGRPVLVGHSRKRFLQKILGRQIDERLYGTVGVSIALAQQSVDIIRVHDVAANRDALIAWNACKMLHSD
jgi:dihydropteroate synthase